MGEGVFRGHRALVLRKEETRLHGGGGDILLSLWG